MGVRGGQLGDFVLYFKAGYRTEHGRSRICPTLFGACTPMTARLQSYSDSYSPAKEANPMAKFQLLPGETLIGEGHMTYRHEYLNYSRPPAGW